MNKTQHTPGPWHVLHQYTDRRVFPIGEDNGDGSHTIIAEANALGGTEENWGANARLIAAAPDLLAALKECITDDGALCLAYGTDTPTLRRRLAAINSLARSALAKAQWQEGGAE
jgi:hypothetical protein